MTQIKPLRSADRRYTTAPLCPYCGFEMTDAWELSLKDDGDVYERDECGRCGRPYSITLHVEISYSTKKNMEEELKIQAAFYAELEKLIEQFPRYAKVRGEDWRAIYNAMSNDKQLTGAMLPFRKILCPHRE